MLADLAALDAAGHDASVALQGRELVAVDERGRRSSPASARGPRRDVATACLGLAIDLGTTSLAAALVSLDDGRVLASASALNPQVAFGADVISRIRHETRRAGAVAIA